MEFTLLAPSALSQGTRFSRQPGTRKVDWRGIFSKPSRRYEHRVVHGQATRNANAPRGPYHHECSEATIVVSPTPSLPGAWDPPRYLPRLLGASKHINVSASFVETSVVFQSGWRRR